MLWCGAFILVTLAVTLRTVVAIIGVVAIVDVATAIRMATLDVVTSMLPLPSPS